MLRNYPAILVSGFTLFLSYLLFPLISLITLKYIKNSEFVFSFDEKHVVWIYGMADDG